MRYTCSRRLRVVSAAVGADAALGLIENPYELGRAMRDLLTP